MKQRYDVLSSSSTPVFAMERRFDHAPALTVGVEEEVILLDPETFLPTDSVEDVLSRMDGDPRFKPELRCAQLELVTPPASTVADVARELAAARRILAERLRGEIRFAALGTHPSSTTISALTPSRRYREISQESRWLARAALPSGLHVHVAVDGAERAVAVCNALRSYVPEIAALAANSPFYEGRDTGLASTRLKLREDNPRSGIPPAFESWRAYTDFVAWGARGGLIRDPSYLWWDLRLNAVHGTIEIRAADAQTRLDDVAGIAALCQSIVASLVDRHDAGDRLPVHDNQRIAENRWRAMRDGLGGELVDLDDGRPIATRERLRYLVGELEPYALALGCERELGHAADLVTANGAVRQRAIAGAVGVDRLVEWLSDETEVSSPSAGPSHLQIAPEPARVAGGRLT
jgi:glutamate---cysteine ligase / carboxylate-amine ligase